MEKFLLSGEKMKNNICADAPDDAEQEYIIIIRF